MENTEILLKEFKQMLVNLEQRGQKINKNFESLFNSFLIALNLTDKLIIEIKKNLDKKYSLDELCNIANLEHTSLIAIFKEKYGYPPLHYINKLRIDESKILITQTNKSFTKIAFDLGFSSSQHFTKIFTRFTT